MPVLFDSSTSNNLAEFGNVTTGSVSATHVISPSAPSPMAVVAVYLAANVNTTGYSLAVTFGGTAMTQAAVLDFESHQNVLAVYTLANPPTGSRTVTATVSSLTGSASGFWLMLDTASYSGVLNAGTPVTVTGDSAGASTSNSVTVTSVAAAHRVVTVHAVKPSRLFSAYNKTIRSSSTGLFAYMQYLLGIFPIGWATASGGQLLLGDDRGAGSVTGTATQPSTALWGAIGLPLAPSPVVVSSTMDISLDSTVRGHISRAAPPEPRRTWVIK